jgi:hypothetical protein
MLTAEDDAALSDHANTTRSDEQVMRLGVAQVEDIFGRRDLRRRTRRQPATTSRQIKAGRSVVVRFRRYAAGAEHAGAGRALLIGKHIGGVRIDRH